MQFHLRYDGELKSHGDRKHKHQIRRALHPQLRELWTHDPLRESPDRLDESSDLHVIQRVGPFVFASVVNDPLKLVAELEITLLRPETPGGIVGQGGDIDNRLKTLFDALRIPKVEQEIPHGETWDGEGPFHCLLDDDERIVRVSVDVDRLLDASNPRAVSVLMRVRTRPVKVIYANLPLT